MKCLENGVLFMAVFKGFNKEEEKNADYFIRTKVDDLIEQSIQEGKRRKQIENNVSDACADISTNEGYDYLTSISDFSAFPKYRGRGLQESAPDITGSLTVKGEATLVMRYEDVSQEEFTTFESEIKSSGFEPKGKDCIKVEDGIEYTISVSYADGKMRVFHKMKALK